MNKKMLIIIPIVFVLVLTIFIQSPTTGIHLVFANGTPDAFNNQIVSICISTYNGTDWNYNINGYYGGTDSIELPSDVTNHVVYSSGNIYWRITATYPVRFRVVTYMNKTLADSAYDAIIFTNIYMNITDGGYSLINEHYPSGTGSSLNATYWKVISTYDWSVGGLPQAGILYNLEVAYYADM